MLKHGFTVNWENDRFYRIYYWLRDRAKAKRDKYKIYWSKWIDCEWKCFEDFYKDMYESYVEHCKQFWEKETSIDRIDNSKWYSKENCRWATHSEQTINRDNVRNIEVNWKLYNSQILAEECWIPTDTASWRITCYLKWKIWVKSLLTKWKIDQRNYVIIDWVKYFNKDIERITWVNSSNARRRLRLYQQGKINADKLLSPRRLYPN